MKTFAVETELAGKKLRFETGYIARQAKAAVVAYYGETVVFSAVCTADPRPGIDFFPLSVEYKEKTQAAGKFPGGFMKREGRPTNKEILTSRLIDRPIRPLFADGYNDEVQITSFVVQVDKENDPDIVAMLATFATLHIADIPFQGPLGAVRVGRIDGKLVLNPTVQEMPRSEFDIVFAGTRDAIMMVEGVCAEISEQLFLEALDLATSAIRTICNLMDELRRQVGTVRTPWEAPAPDVDPELEDIIDSARPAMQDALLLVGKHERADAVKSISAQVIESYVREDDDDAAERTKAAKKAIHDLENKIIRELLLRGRRLDGRKVDEIREIDIKVGWMSRLHGSAIFTRGETQALVVCTLGTVKDQQIVDGLTEEYAKRFDLQYNFPPFSVGEVKPQRGPGRREIGHGNLAERALQAVIPDPKVFPYTVRLISDIMESNGSSSMATVCGGTLAMMDAGIPIKQPVAGIAMGLLIEGSRFVVLSDIMGAEDHHGDMDFKVAGTGRGITAVQMDIKVRGITREIMAKALEQARVGRRDLLKHIIKAMPRPATEISKYAPRLLITQVPVDKIGLIIGPGGKNIKKLQEETSSTVEIMEDGTVHISSTVPGGAEAAKQRVDLMVAEVEIGRTYLGKVVSIKDFGAFIEILPGQEGLCHVSELSDKYISKVQDVVRMGDTFEVKVIARDEQDRIKLSRKAVLLEQKPAR